MSTGRRPPDPTSLGALDPISDTNWDSLDELQRADLLRKREAAMLERHRQLMQGVSSVRNTVDAQGASIKAQASATRSVLKVQEAQGGLLQENTAATERTEKKVDDLVTNTADMLALFNDVVGTFRLIGRIAEGGKRLLWVGIPGGAIYGGYHVVVAWLKTQGKA